MTEELKPGQKFPTPTPGFGDRVFYETLFRQRPNSAMAQEWCVAYGVLPHDEAARVHELVQERKRHQRSGPSSPPPPSSSSTARSKKQQQQQGSGKPRVLKDNGVDAEMQISSGDAIGRSSL